LRISKLVEISASPRRVDATKQYIAVKVEWLSGYYSLKYRLKLRPG
jgi:hypothetical protein